MQKKHSFTQPVNLRALVEVCDGNSAQAARLLSVSSSVISKSLAQNSTRTVNELAATAVLGTMPSVHAHVDDAADVRLAMHKIAIYMASTPALSMPSDIFDMLGKTVKELAEEDQK